MTLDFDFVLRLLVAGILGAIIGLDREYRAKEAGYRTHFLVTLWLITHLKSIKVYWLMKARCTT